MNKILYSTIIFAVFSFAACGGGGGSSSNACSPLNAKHSKVYGGDSCNQDARSPVVFLVAVARSGEQLFQFGSCTGALVTVDDLVTSAHCFTEPIKQARAAGVEIAGFAAVVGGQQGEVLVLVDAAIHPLYDGRAGSRFDIAMATLNKVPSPPISPLPILVSEITEPGSEINAFGYGTNKQGEVGELRASKFTVDALSNGNLLVTGDGKSSICPGDSGGPAVYVTSRGVATIAGVNSFIVGQCASNAARGFGFVDLQYESILRFITAYAPDVAVS